MKFFLITIVLIFSFVQCSKTSTPPPLYPKIEKKEILDFFFNKKIKDPYRNIENINDTTVVNWLKKQEELATAILTNASKKTNLATAINSSIKEQSVTISNLQITYTNQYFYLKKYANDTLSKLFFRDGFNGKEILLYDPVNFTSSSSSSNYSINYIQPSWDALKVVIGFTKNDEEFSVLKILDVGSKKLLQGEAVNAFPNALGGVEWLPDNSGFIYTYIPIIQPLQKNYLFNAKAVICKIGQHSNKITPIFSRDTNPEINFKEESFPLVFLTNPKATILLGVNATGTSMYRDTYFASISDLVKNKVTWKPLFKKQDNITSLILGKNYLYYRTSKNATNFKICKTPLANPNFENPDILIEEDSTAVITDMAITNKGLFYVKTKNGVNAKLYFLDKNTKQSVVIPLPKPSGFINVKSKGYNYEDLWIEIEGWIHKKELYKYNYNSKLFEGHNLSPIQQYPELKDVMVEEIEVPSYDGVSIPLSIIYKKGTKKNNKNRLLINAYGAYEWSNSPYLYPYLLYWIKEGGMYAVAHVRGGGEKGEAWHKAGFKTTKPNSWKDLIACTEYFINHNYTTKDKIAVWGASAGGVCVGRAITERPDLYAAAIIRVGVLNAMRREFGSNGKNNTREYGTVKDSVEFEALYKMDAYQHIKNGIHYPAVYLTAGIKDSRVPFWQPAKFAARLQEASASKKPILLSVDFDGGHGFDASQYKKNKEVLNILTFALWQTGHPNYQPK
jgi:prolyl oligopeptidase